MPGLLDLLAQLYGQKVSPEDWGAYFYGILAQPAYTEQFHDELSKREVRVPITKSGDLFEQVAHIGRNLVWLHTYGERMVPNGKRRGQLPRGMARCTVAVPDGKDNYPETFDYDPDRRTLLVGGGRFAPVSPEVWEFEVSGLKVVQSWLGYRMKRRAGKRSSPLDDIGPERWTAEFTTELLHLLWILEATLAAYPEQAELLNCVLTGELVNVDELPEVPTRVRKAPKIKVGLDLFGA
ncbi:DNA methyltransferase [Salinisphaera sp. PC39]